MNLSPVIGIDLGTTFSCVGALVNGQVEIIPNEQGSRITRSCVAFTELERVIGDIAIEKAILDPTNTIFDAKRMIGRSFDDKTIQADKKRWPFKVEEIDGKIKIEVSYANETKTFYPEEISSMVLKKMKEIAEDYLGETVNEAVITVPAYFNNSQRQATCDAALIAGINVLQIINEPTAAAIAYSLQKQESKKRNVLVYDLGGGTFDVSIASIENKKIDIKSTSGNTHLGGEDFTNRIVEYCIEIIKQKHNKDLTSDRRAIFRLREKCNNAKHKLSSVTETSIIVDCLFDGIDFSTTLTRLQFNEINEDLFDSTIEIVEKALSDAKIERSQIDDIVLVGGSTRIIKIQELVQDFFERKVLTKSINPDEAVAYGATVRAGVLKDDKTELTHNLILQDVTSLSLGTNITGDRFSVIIPRNTKIPTKMTCPYTTSEDNQTSCFFKILEGERLKATENHFLGELLLSGIPSTLRGKESLRLQFSIDINGILEATAHAVSVDSKVSATFNYRKSRLKASEVFSMIELAQLYEKEDKKRTFAVAAKHNLESYCTDVKRVVKKRSLPKKIAETDQRMILDQSNETITWLRSNEVLDGKIYEEKLNKLKNIFDKILKL